MTVREVLINARAKVAAGWCQGFDQVGDCYCAYGALDKSCPETPEGDVLMQDVCCSLRRANNLQSIFGFNDTPGRTQAEVLALFDRAIEECGE